MRRDAGQAAVELALALPVVVVLLLGMLQVALVGRDQLAVELAAREAARAAAVSADPVAAARAAADRVTTLRPLSRRREPWRRRRSPSPCAIAAPPTSPSIGRLIDDVDLRATATMALEPP